LRKKNLKKRPEKRICRKKTAKLEMGLKNKNLESKHNKKSDKKRCR